MIAIFKRAILFLRAHKVELGLGVRVTAAAISALLIALTIGLKLPLWAVLTAIIVTQMSVGRSLKATRDYLVGTIGGAIYGGAVAILVPHTGEGALLAVLVLAVAPLAFIAALNPSLNVATVTAIIVLLLPITNHTTPLESAVDRVLEVAVGAITGLLVSFLVLPSRAHSQIRVSAAHVIDLIAAALSELLAGLTRGRDNDAEHEAPPRADLAVAFAARRRDGHQAPARERSGSYVRQSSVRGALGESEGSCLSSREAKG